MCVCVLLYIYIFFFLTLSTFFFPVNTSSAWRPSNRNQAQQAVSTPMTQSIKQCITNKHIENGNCRLSQLAKNNIGTRSSQMRTVKELSWILCLVKGLRNAKNNPLIIETKKSSVKNITVYRCFTWLVIILFRFQRHTHRCTDGDTDGITAK